MAGLFFPAPAVTVVLAWLLERPAWPVVDGMLPAIADVVPVTRG